MNPILLSTLLKYKKIILVGGGTGGHIQPIVSLVKHIRNTHEIINFTWIGGVDSQEEKTAKDENIQFQSISTLKLSTTRSFKVFLYPIVLLQGILEAKKVLKNIKKEDDNIAVFSKGGPGSVAIGIAASSLSIPLYIHESDTIPGRSNRILGKFAERVFLGFEIARQYFDNTKCEVIGQILDPIFSMKPSEASKKESSINWKTNKPHILVICGSQGAKSIFEAIIEQFSENTNYEWIIALGKLNSNLATEFEKIPDCQAIDWISQSDIAHLIQETNIAISRGSATTLAELTAFKNKPNLIIVPLPYSAGNHQFYNAKEYEKIGHTILEQKNLHQLTEIITKNVGYNI